MSQCEYLLRTRIICDLAQKCKYFFEVYIHLQNCVYSQHSQIGTKWMVFAIFGITFCWKGLANYAKMVVFAIFDITFHRQGLANYAKIAAFTVFGITFCRHGLTNYDKMAVFAIFGITFHRQELAN